MYVAFFDLDHTILNISSGRIMFKGSWEHKLIGRKEIFKAIIITILYRMGIMSAESAIERWLRWYRGMSSEMIKPTAMYCSEKLIKEIRNDARREVKFHQDKGAHTVILSASTAFFCDQIKTELQMDDIICTELEFIDDRFTGKMKGRYCYGTEKLIRARQYCKDKGLSMVDAFYYADSIADLPVFEAVGVPVCITPDKKLEKMALKRGWKIDMWQ
jgi:HAD superfamily hydrolase (TIGR01490 family)